MGWNLPESGRYQTWARKASRLPRAADARVRKAAGAPPGKGSGKPVVGAPGPTWATSRGGTAGNTCWQPPENAFRESPTERSFHSGLKPQPTLNLIIEL